MVWFGKQFRFENYFLPQTDKGMDERVFNDFYGVIHAECP